VLTIVALFNKKLSKVKVKIWIKISANLTGKMRPNRQHYLQVSRTSGLDLREHQQDPGLTSVIKNIVDFYVTFLVLLSLFYKKPKK
jgi:hypothetical protein